MGQFACSPLELLRTIHEHLEGPKGLDSEQCEIHCQQEQLCKFFFIGTVMSAQVCRLYSSCATLYRELGSEGRLAAMNKNVMACAIANPVLCMHTTVRRRFLLDTRPDDVAFLQPACLNHDLMNACQHKLMLGGIGVGECGPCTFGDTSAASASNEMVSGVFKSPLVGASHGQALQVQCWQERYVVLKKTGSSGFITCLDGRWVDADGFSGLSNFACGACIQIVGTTYMDLYTRGYQELFFGARQYFKIEAITPKGTEVTAMGTDEIIPELVDGYSITKRLVTSIQLFFLMMLARF